MGLRTNVIASLERGAKVKEDFKGRLLGVHQRCSRDAHVRLWVDTEHGASLDAIEDHHRKRINVSCLFRVLLISGLIACLC